MVCNRRHALSFTSPEKQGAKQRPECGIVSAFGEYIGRIALGIDVIEFEESSSDSFPNLVVGKCIPPFSKQRMWKCGICDNGLVVTKHEGWAINWDTKVTKCEM